MSRLTSKRRQSRKAALEPVALSDESCLILRSVWQTLKGNATAIATAVAAINANTSQCLDELAKTLAARQDIDLSTYALNCDTEQWVAKPKGANNGKMAQ